MARELTHRLNTSSASSLCGFLFCQKEAEVSRNAANFYVGAPLPGRFMEADALDAGCIVFWGGDISAVLKWKRLAKVRNPIVGPDRVDVVNFFVRPLTVRHSPRDSMSAANNTIDICFDVTLAQPANPVTRRSPPTSPLPVEMTKIWIVNKQLVESGDSDFHPTSMFERSAMVKA